MNNIDKIIVYGILKDAGFSDMEHSKGLKSTRMKDATKSNPPPILPTYDNIEDVSTNIKGEGVEKIILPSNSVDIYTRLEVSLGLKLSRHTLL